MIFKERISSRFISGYSHLKMTSALVHTVPNNLGISSYSKSDVIAKEFMSKILLFGFKFKILTYQADISKNFHEFSVLLAKIEPD